ncbi:MAG: hypothetical protein A2921_04625 [Candidatus Magasanikbacteria bacterium RIFCSPLOWO2_01_FULL_43_20b]|uniref:Uncharacterized protein n=1 Tax=Candidatus Magasanikbacteria bacterium RIFCSPLOWO2_12_FULL_43_12 TaxID=1798692 RepID=A0A1F6MSL6_9BACT|nr:MAG: hypothetical protein A3I93_01315 [Candidatus Magasanikbacteria bacterium RIFCSPLOWO2_02_FULL_43_22]OGH71642.1 MAG: hypothetical protein A3C74_00355 [Candidatus Magasanikbacteria bacterium RIFCSPHIGHO2_02_FULL_44_13]OGH73069.1 MAG: hypothetical protein A2921_04625 [Candidatus Magasanikbacteria bacterium RIFCSPLOWO2_01_FULL_43_20b]OGH74433.1 MAG: hypothetical protein A3G00_01065 [Candidatus Magasanikbacteria bacterium RIFCSPLOWO2_12_FULL_43_12]
MYQKRADCVGLGALPSPLCWHQKRQELVDGNHQGGEASKQDSEQDENETEPVARWQSLEAAVWFEDTQADGP